MFAAMLFAISIVAVSQFAIYYWRAVLASVAAQPVSDQVLDAANVQNRVPVARDFAQLAGLHDLTPELQGNRGGLGLVRFYYGLTKAIDTLVGARVPVIAAWSEREGSICARYAAVLVDRRLQMNLAMAASIRSC